MGFQRESEHAMHIDMTPVVDAMFTLILFLVVTSSYVQSMEQDVNINLPTMNEQLKVAKPPARPIVVNVRYLPGGNAYYHVENEKMTLTTLTINMARARVRNQDQSVVIRGDKDVKWDHVAKVMGCCAQAGITKVSATLEVNQ
ncbi:MAG: biopolymer transporter ExbD [Lentisphaerae bacterium]|nr:biopolymer transporter ExbD [Lentisphaerota bacterium]